MESLLGSLHLEPGPKQFENFLHLIGFNSFASGRRTKDGQDNVRQRNVPRMQQEVPFMGLHLCQMRVPQGPLDSSEFLGSCL